ncbi:hypothetical protein HanRHA438_Chr07g0326451 [Helianthus annuus]|nr:hypothetical protein HanRHA438_Chr07g0326451 [Helianthus annuus]
MHFLHLILKNLTIICEPFMTYHFRRFYALESCLLIDHFNNKRKQRILSVKNTYFIVKGCVDW